MSGFEHWLDRRAVAIAMRGKGAPTPDPMSESPRLEATSRSAMFAELARSTADRLPAPRTRSKATIPAADHRLTRSTALKAAAGLFVLIGVPARVARARAHAKLPCENKCIEQYQKALGDRLAGCEAHYGNQNYHPGNTVDFLFGTPRAAANLPMKAICDAWVVRSTQSDGADCLKMCDAQDHVPPPAPVCDQSKSAKSAQRAERAGRCASSPPPPPDLQPPSYTPPAVDTGCANCASVGGKCCESADPTKPICVCAEPSSDCCMVYGCCS
jgi:hypothetical protein